MGWFYKALFFGSIGLAALSGGIVNNRWVDAYTSTREWLNHRSAIVQLYDTQQMDQRLREMHGETQRQIAELSTASHAPERPALPSRTVEGDVKAVQRDAAPVQEKAPVMRETQASAVNKLESIASGGYFAIQNDPYTVRSWNHNKDQAWYSIMSKPGRVNEGRWMMPATLVKSTGDQDTLRFTLDTALQDRNLVFRLLFSRNNSIVGSAYCKPGSETELALAKDLYAGPVQYELARQGIDKQLHILASGRNLHFSAAQKQPVAEHGQGYQKADNASRDARNSTPVAKAEIAPLQQMDTTPAITYLPAKMPSLGELAELKQRHTEYLNSGNCTGTERQNCMYNIQFMEAAMRGKQV